MSKFLELSKLTFIGGSMVNHGGQNPLEAVRMGNYIMHGKKVENFKEIYKELKNLKISSEVNNLDQMKNVFSKKFNYKKSRKIINKIDHIGKKIFKSNIQEIKNYL